MGLRSYGISFQKPHFFYSKLFFQWFWETFLYVVWLCSSYLRDCLNIVLYPGKKIRNVRHVKQIIWQETRKSLHFYFENGVEKLWGYPSKTTILDSKLFFRKLLENFLFVAWPCLIYLKDAPNIVLYVNKKNWDRTTHQSKNIHETARKNPILKRTFIGRHELDTFEQKRPTDAFSVRNRFQRFILTTKTL